MAELDLSDLIEKPAPTVDVAVGAGAYRTTHIATKVIPPPPLPRWYRAGAFLLRTAIGEQRAATRPWYRRATGGRWSRVADTDGEWTWTRVSHCPGRYNAFLQNPAPGCCFDDVLMADAEVMGYELPPPICYCEIW